MANDCIPYFIPGTKITAKCTAGVTGKTFVAVSGNRTGGPGLSTDLADVPQVAPAGAGVRGLGVADKDGANGSLIGVWVKPGLILPVTAGATITYGQELELNASGQVIPYAAGIKVGMALSGAASTADCQVKLY